MAGKCQFALALVAVLVWTPCASALTATWDSDFRFIEVFADTDTDTDSDLDTPGVAFAPFAGSVSASANTTDFATASADINSSTGPLSIWASGTTQASGDGTGFFRADADSVTDIIFTIDMPAIYHVMGTISAAGPAGTQANIDLEDQSDFSQVFEQTVMNDIRVVNMMGIINAGTYRFTADADAFVEHLPNGEIRPETVGEMNAQASYTDVIFQLSEVPEPLPATLALLGMGALLGVTHRRRANDTDA